MTDATPEGWLWQELQAASKEVASWPPGMRREDPTMTNDRAREEARKIVVEHLGKYGPGSAMEKEIVTALLATEQREREACIAVVQQFTGHPAMLNALRVRGKSHDQG